MVVAWLAIGLILFTDYTGERTTQYMYGWLYVSLLTFLLVVNSSFVIKNLLGELRLWILKKWALYKMKKYLEWKR